MATTPDRVGPYMIETILGRGNFGTVYKGRHAESGSLAAVKVVGPIDVQARRSLRREIEQLSRFSHPGIVRVRHYDTESELPYYAMDLVEGLTLEQWAEERLSSKEQDLSAEDAREIARLVGGLCATLSHLHAAGLVHRDLNPHNVLLRADGEPILIDFGLVARFPGAATRENVAVDLQAAGRLGYMAPEVIRGELVDGRADLYSIGCILFELLTREPPFSGPPSAVLEGHLHRRVSVPRERRRGVPERLSDLALELLEKDPSRRLSYAADVASRLLDGVEVVGASNAQPLLYRPPLVGRQVDLSWLDELAARTRDAGGGVAIVTGEGGIGKTRLLIEASRRALAKGFAVFAGSCEAASPTLAGATAGLPLAGLRGALASLADRCQEWGLHESDRVLGARGRVLAAFEPSLARVPGHDAHPPPPHLAPEGTRQRILDALTETWLDVSTHGPVLVIVDDLQWADDLTLAWLEAIARSRAYARAGVLVLGAFRSEGYDVPAARLLDIDGVASRWLPAFPPDEVLNLARDLLGTRTLDGPFGQKLTDASAGNPLFVTEYLLLGLADGAIQRGPEGWSFQPPAPDAPSLPVPRTVSELVRSRLDRLSPAARWFADAAAVLGDATPLTTLQAMLGKEAVDLGDVVQELLRRRVIASDADPTKFRLTHDQLREVVYQEMPPSRRIVLHQRAGARLERELSEGSGAPEVEGQGYARLANHFVGAEDRDKALLYLDKAADAAVGTFSNRDARLHLRRALALDAEGSVDVLRRAKWYRLLGTVENALGLIDSSRASFAQALELLGHPFPTSRAGFGRGALGQAARLLVEGIVADDERGTDEQAQLAEEALLGHQGIGYLVSDGVGVLYNCLKMMNLARTSGRPSSLTRAYATMGLALGLIPWRRAAERFFRRSREVAGACGDPESAAWALLVEGYYRMGSGALMDARAALESAERMSATTGNLRRREECLVLLGEAALLAGDHARASTISEEALVSARARMDGQTQLWALANLARVALHGGDPKAALRDLSTARAFVQKTVPPDGIMIEGLLSLAKLNLGRADEALAHAEDTVRLLRGGESAVYYASHGCWGAVQTLLRQAGVLGGQTQREVLALAETCVSALKRHASLYPVARPRYWLAEAARRRLRNKGSPGHAFDQAARAATSLGVALESVPGDGG